MPYYHLKQFVSFVSFNIKKMPGQGPGIGFFEGILRDLMEQMKHYRVFGFMSGRKQGASIKVNNCPPPQSILPSNSLLQKRILDLLKPTTILRKEKNLGNKTDKMATTSEKDTVRCPHCGAEPIDD